MSSNAGYDENVDYINRLHNHLSRAKQLGSFDWDLSASGPPNSPTHLAKAILNGEVIGSATANARNVAKRYAAFHALVKLGAL
ncbi:hypothetical protein PENSPDRAFT_691455 [Peniophora sp. CONT]|nr:hypothetical protein PENSPDRAFT_691455 [Peniophora sp. CONT]